MGLIRVINKSLHFSLVFTALKNSKVPKAQRKHNEFCLKEILSRECATSADSTSGRVPLVPLHFREGKYI